MTPRRVTLKDIAGKVGLTRAAVSMALRGDGRIPEPTRNRVLAAAKALGYRADPELGRILSAVRRAGRFEARDVIAMLYHRDRWFDYGRALAEGITANGREMGIIPQLIEIGQFKSGMGLGRRLRAVGVRGVCIFPLPVGPLLRDMDWRPYHTLSFFRLQQEPLFHRVLPDHAKNSLIAFQHLVEKGFLRIGFMTDKASDARIQAHPRFGFLRAREVFRYPALPPLLLSGKKDLEKIRSWLQRYEPDAVIVSDDEVLSLLRAVMKSESPSIVSLGSTLSDKGIFRVVQHPELIAKVGLRLLMGQIASDEPGIPLHPCTTLLAGEWVEPSGDQAEEPHQ